MGKHSIAAEGDRQTEVESEQGEEAQCLGFLGQVRLHRWNRSR